MLPPPLPPEAKEEKRRPKEDAIIKATDLAALNSCALEQRISYLKTIQCGATYPEATTTNATEMDNSTNTNLTSEGINTLSMPLASDVSLSLSV